ncbi:MAG: type II secretion system protein [Acidovorax sp.]|uniref:type II secretion system protein n=1 Tax=Acidovorax sp. TaxID=1872122 RepID=UPI00391A1FBD
MMKRSLRRESGFSLVELAVAMVIIGVIGIFVWRWVVSTREPMQRPAMMRQLSEAQSAVEGFVLRNARLPCAAAGTNGSESCGDAAAVRLPWRTLGLSSEFGRLHYGVNRGGGWDLAEIPNLLVRPADGVSPDLYIDFTGMPELPDYPSTLETAVTASASVVAAAGRATAAIVAAKGRRLDPLTGNPAPPNGLDWCRVLRRFAANPTAAGVLAAGNVANSVPVAFVLAHPGENGAFDGNNAVGAGGSWQFDFPGRPQDNNFDDLALAVGPADLAARIGCAARLSEMQAVAQGAYAAYDNARVMQEYWKLRVFDIETSESAVQGAKTGVALAAMGLALATASGVLSIASAANTEGVTAFIVVMAAANVGLSIAETVLAAQELVEAEAALVVSKQKQAAADTYAVQLYDTFTSTLNHAVSLDTKGLNP